MRQILSIESKLIGKAEYDSELEELTIIFSKTGDTWKYLGVPQLEINCMVHAISSGSYFLTHIKSRYKEIKL
jgi:hypothetical protein